MITMLMVVSNLALLETTWAIDLASVEKSTLD